MTREALKRLEAGLPGTWYYDPAHYQRELEAFWYRRWVAVAREEELPGPGDWRTVRIGTQSIVLVRDEDRIRGFHNTCRHRGSILCTEERGNFTRRGTARRRGAGAAVQALPVRRAAHRQAHRRRRAGELEAAGRELLGMLPLSAGASGAVPPGHCLSRGRRLGFARPGIQSRIRGASANADAGWQRATAADRHADRGRAQDDLRA